MNIVKIKSIKKISTSSKRYDIQTKKNNNFFANGILVHNSLLIVSHDPFAGNWFFSTRSCTEADIPNNLGHTFTDLAYMALKEMGINSDEFFAKLDKGRTYLFELVSPYSQVYVFYPKPQLYLLMVRDNISHQELPIEEIAKELGVPVPKQYNLSTLEEIVATVNAWNGTEHEGVVVVDQEYNRIKVKNINYVAGQSLVFSLPKSNRNIMRIVIMGQDDDIYSNCPEFIQQKIDLYRGKLAELISNTMQTYSKLSHIDDMKQFAELAKKERWTGALFMLKRGKINNLEKYIKDNVVSNSFIDSIFALCGIDGGIEND